jgi:hypothetical protein
MVQFNILMRSPKWQHRGGGRVRAIRRSLRQIIKTPQVLLIIVVFFSTVVVCKILLIPALSAHFHHSAQGQILPDATAKLSGNVSTLVSLPSLFSKSASLLSSPYPTSEPISDATSSSQTLGIAAGSSLPGLSSSELNTTLDGIAATGAKWLRFDFDWSQIQPNNSQSYNWAPYDAVVAAATTRHLSILGIIDYTPSWAQPAGCSDNKCEPSSAALYGTFAKTLASHYASSVHDWEIWNEPNNPGFWQPAPNPKAYVALLQASYSAIHSVEPNETVITGGLSPQATTSDSYSPYDFLSAVYQDGGKPYFDAVADHPYTFPLSPTANADDAWTQMANPTNSLRSLMVASGDANKQIWITEFGSPTGGPGPVATLSNPNLAASPYVVDPGLQASILSDAITLYRTYSWAGPFFYYSYQDAGTDQSTNENFFGLITASGAQKPAYAVFQQAAENP